MTSIIKDKAIIDSPYTIQSVDDADVSVANVILPISVYVENESALTDRSDVGVWLSADDEVEQLTGKLDQLALVALDFPSFGDGRAYSNANILRRKLGYTGEVRAIGDVRRDQLEQMLRCGFDAFQLADGQDIATCVANMKTFSFNYQTSIDRPEPLFRSR